MSEPVVCPVCETPNDPESTHCEVCGERLTPPEPGEELAPEENVAATFEDDEFEEAPADEAAVELEPAEIEPIEAEEGAEALQLEEVPPDETDVEMDPEAIEQPIIEPEPVDDVEPTVLYSPIDGTAYPEGTPEFEEGFGPQGEELVATPPDDLPEAEFELDDEAPADDEVEVDEPADEMLPEDADVAGDEEEEDLPESVAGTSEQFQQLFKPRPRASGEASPLPEPGALAEPAILTVYANREPVLTYGIDTDETLIGRRDPVSDAYPDVDLSEIDEASVVSRKHAYIFRQNKNYTLYVVSNAGTQLNSDLLELGERRKLSDGDIIVLAGAIAIKFELPE